MSAPPVVLTIAGFDPSSGAGITADIKTIAAHGCYCVACITAMTLQSTRGVRRVEALSAALVSDTLRDLATDLTFAAVKIGMLGSGEVAQAVADYLQRDRPPNVVLDPILKSSSGADLLDDVGFAVLRDRIIQMANVITPNIDEAAKLTGLSITDLAEMAEAARALHALGAQEVIVTGGHLDPPVDVLSADGRMTQIPGEKIQSTSTHGTGCAFATSLACNLALGHPIPQATAMAKAYVAGAIRNAYPVGKGTGPVNHFWR